MASQWMFCDSERASDCKEKERKKLNGNGPSDNTIKFSDNAQYPYHPRSVHLALFTREEIDDLPRNTNREHSFSKSQTF